jgi:two-component system, sensor histidine kinase and response regulator
VRVTRPSPAFLALGSFMTALVMVRILVPDVVGDTAYVLAAWTAPVVAWLGTARARSGERLVPALIASGLTAAAVGHLIWQVYAWTGRDPDLSLADFAFLAGYIGLGAAVSQVPAVSPAGVRVASAPS